MKLRAIGWFSGCAVVLAALMACSAGTSSASSGASGGAKVACGDAGSCAAPKILGTVSGDAPSAPLRAQGTGSAWFAVTVTEDVDLGYRAQFGDWKYAYLSDVVSMSVLPETISAFRMQRERWGRGLIHSAFKHVGQMARQHMPLMKRLHAISVMFSSLLLASIYVLVLLSLPLNYLVDLGGASIQWWALLFFGLVAVWALDNSVGAYRGGRIELRSSLGRMLWETYLYVAMFLPMAWYYFVGGVRALFGVYGDFHRTPKGREARRGVLPRIHTVLMAGEIFTFSYSAVSIPLEWARGHYFLIPLSLTVCVGFGMVLYWSWRERCADVPA